MNPALAVFVSAFLLAALAGLAALLRSNAPLKAKSVTSALANSGLLGLGIALLWYTRAQDDIYLLVGVCVVAGLGGMTTVDFVLELVRRGGLSIRVGGDADKKGGDRP